MLRRDRPYRLQVVNQATDASAGTQEHVRHRILSLGADPDDDAVVALSVDLSARDLDNNPVVDRNPAESAAPWPLWRMLAGAIGSLLRPPLCS